MPNSKHIQQLDLNLLKVFQTLYLEQNMTRAADVLHLTPSAVSHAMKRLRETLGDPLFQRSQNKMMPTPACQRIAPLIIDNLARLQQILQQLGDFDPATSEHHFRIGMHDAFEPSIVPQLTKTLSKLAPNVRFSSIKVSRRDLARDLSAGHVDMVIDVALAAAPPIKHQEILENDFVVLLRKGHPLLKNNDASKKIGNTNRSLAKHPSAQKNQLSSKDYLSATHLNVSNRPSGMTAEDTLFQERGLARNVTVRCQNHFAAKEIVKNSDQLLTLPRILAAQLIDPEVYQCALPVELPRFSVHVYWHEHSEQDAALAWLRTLFIEQSVSLYNQNST